MSTSVARTINSIPARTAIETWRLNVDLLAKAGTDAHVELMSVQGIACALITDKAMTSPVIATGNGPRVRVYCQYDDDAIEGDGANESALPSYPTDGDWAVSLPCEASDLAWVQEALTDKSTRITARDKALGIRLTLSEVGESSSKAEVLFDTEAFLRS